MTPETKALIARAIQCHSAMTTTADSLTYAGANRELRRLAPQLATALEAESKRADKEKKRADEMEQMAGAFSNLMMNCADTLRSRGIPASVGPLDIRVIELAKRADANKARADAAEAKLEALNREYKDAGKHISLQVARAESAEAKLKVAESDCDQVEGALVDVCGRYHLIVIEVVEASNSGDLEEISKAVSKLRDLAALIQESCRTISESPKQ